MAGNHATARAATGQRMSGNLRPPGDCQGRIDCSAGPFAKRNNANRSFMPDRIVKSPDNARAASKEGVVRYVLVISVALVVILFVVGYLVS